MFEAVNGIDLQVNAGEIFGFLGQNGAGKKHRGAHAHHAAAPNFGQGIRCRIDVAKTSKTKFRQRIGVALQDAAIDPLMTGVELLRLQAVFVLHPKVEDEVTSR